MIEKCDKCNFSSDVHRNFIRHICKPKTEFQCKHCLKYYKTQKILNDHIINKCSKNPEKEIQKLKDEITKTIKKQEFDKIKEEIRAEIKEEFLREETDKIKKEINEKLLNEELGIKKEIEEEIEKEKKKKNKLSASLRYKVWNTYIGIEYGSGKCFCCFTTYIYQQSFECGHVISVNQGGIDSVENLRPICSLCNKSMGILNMDKFCDSLFK